MAAVAFYRHGKITPHAAAKAGAVVGFELGFMHIIASLRALCVDTAERDPELARNCAALADNFEKLMKEASADIVGHLNFNVSFDDGEWSVDVMQ